MVKKSIYFFTSRVANLKSSVTVGLMKDETITTIGKTIKIQGQITGDESLVIDGAVDGEITIQKDLQINPSGNLRAKINAGSVTVAGTITGSITALEKVEILAGGVVVGDVTSPRFLVRDGGTLNGKIEMPIPERAAE